MIFVRFIRPVSFKLFGIFNFILISRTSECFCITSSLKNIEHCKSEESGSISFGQKENHNFRLIYSASYLLIFRTLFLHNFASEKYEIQCKSENKIISTRKKKHDFRLMYSINYLLIFLYIFNFFFFCITSFSKNMRNSRYIEGK